MAELKKGDVVQLKSGGPKMTIKGIGKYGHFTETDTALCEWFDGNRRTEDIFELFVLQAANSGGGQMSVTRG